MPTVHPTLPADGDDAVVEPYNAALNLILSVLNGSLDVDNLADGAVTLSKLSTSLQGFLVPTASIIAFGGSAAPTNWLMCDGSSVLRATYPSLFAALGTAYGSADGTHFNLPDLRGRVPMGSDSMSGSAANRIQRSTTITTTNASPTATVGSATGLAIGMFIVAAGVTAGTTILAISGTTITLSANATANGSAVAARFSIVSDAQALGSAGGEDVHKLVTAELAAHNHDIGRAGAVVWAATGASFDTGTFQTGTHDTNSANKGSDIPHNTLQPSVVTNYIIKT